MVAPPFEAVAGLERGIWDAARARRFDLIEGHLAEEYVGVYDPGVRKARAEMLAGLPALDLQRADLEDLRVTPVAPTVVLLTYTLHIEGTVDGAPLHATCLSSALWCWREGVWRNVYYQETPVAAAPRAPGAT